MMSIRTAFAAAAWVLSCTVGAAQPAPAADVAIPDIPFTKFVLKNGLTVVVHEDHKLPVVAVNTWYHVGSKNEKLGKTGFAHLFEHLMFSGSENFDKNWLSAMSTIGATDMNGTTGQDRTNYFQNVPASMVDYVLFAESDRMGHLLGVLDQKKLDIQRGVVQNEKRQRENQPYGTAFEELLRNTYPANHPYSWTPIGSMKDLDAASMEDVRDWFKTYYGPNNVVLVLAGDITPEQAKQKAEKYYGDIPPGPPLGRQESWVARMSGSHRAAMQDRVPAARIYRVWNVPGAHTPEEPLLDLAAQVLGGGKTSRLYRRLVVKDQLASQVNVENDASEIGGQLRIVLTAQPGGDTRRMEAAAAEEVQAFLRDGPSAQELQLARTAILAGYARRLERVGGFGGKSDLLAQCTAFTRQPDCWKDYLRRLRLATTASVHKTAVQWMSDGDFVLEVQPFPDVSAAPGSVDRKTGPVTGAAPVLKMPVPERFTLANGLKVLVAERHGAPVVNVSLLVDSGYASDPQDKAGLATLALRMMDEGTPTRSSEAIARELESLGATFHAHANLDTAFVDMDALKARLPRSLELYADLVLHPVFPAADLDRVRKEQLAAIRQEKVNPSSMARRVIPALLYGPGHAYARPFTGTGTEQAVQRMTREELLAWHGSWFRPNNATLLVVGDTSAAEVRPLLEKAFAGWRAGEVPRKNLATVAPPEQPVVYLMDRPGSVQSTIIGGQLTRTTTPEERVHLQLVNDLLGGSFSSRLNMNLREDKHWSYGAFSSLTPAAAQRPLISYSAVQSDKTAEAFREVLAEYKGLAGERPIAAAELKQAQDRETLALPGEFETNEQLSSAYANIVQYKLPEDYYTRYTPIALAFTPEQANELARQVILPGRQVWVVVGDMAKVEAGIRALGIGEIRRIDADGQVLR